MKLKALKPILKPPPYRPKILPATDRWQPKPVDRYSGGRTTPPAWYSKTKRFRKLARQVRLDSGGFCQHCGALTDRLEVDHIVEVLDGGPIFDRSNLQALCRRCHQLKTQETRRKRKMLYSK